MGCIGLYWAAEIDISVSKLLGFETFANFLRVSVSEVLVLEKSIRFGLKKVSVSENLFLEKSLGFGFGECGLGKKSWFRKIWYWKRKNQNTIPSKQCTSLI